MRLTQSVHIRLKEILKAGDSVLDATAGNGHDSLHMAELIGPLGTLVAIDLQTKAIENTRNKLASKDYLARCKLLQGNHAEVLKQLNGTFKAIVFNLGYLPGSDQKLITEISSTIGALNEVPRLLDTNGLLFVTTYRAHKGGLPESDAVNDWMQKAQKTHNWSVIKIETQTSSEKLPPILWVASPSLLLSETFES